MPQIFLAWLHANFVNLWLIEIDRGAHPAAHLIVIAKVPLLVSIDDGTLVKALEQPRFVIEITFNLRSLPDYKRALFLLHPIN